MEEQRRVQEAEIGRSTVGDSGQQTTSTSTAPSSKKNLFAVLLYQLNNIFSRWWS